MKRPDPRVRRAEKLLAEVLRLLGEIRDGVPAPRPKQKRRRRFKLPAVLAALREGAKLDARGADRDPRLPSRTVLTKYRKANPSFNREAALVLRQRSLEGSRRTGCVSPVRGATVWAERLPGRGHDWDAIAAKIEAGATIGPASPNRQGLPAHTLIMKRRRADPVFAARVAAVLVGRFGRGRRVTFDHEAVLELVRRGAVIKAWPPEPGMPRKQIIDRVRREDPSFNSQALEAISEARRRKKNRTRLGKLSPTAAWRAAETAVPRLLPSDLRDDVVGELSLMICSGEVAIDGDLVAAWKACRTRLNRPRWKESSLDAPILGAGDLRRIDVLADDVEHF